MLQAEIIKLIEASWLRPEDAVEVIRIFECLTPEKQLDILKNWWSISEKILKRREEIERKKQEFLDTALEKMNAYLDSYCDGDIKKEEEEKNTFIQKL